MGSQRATRSQALVALRQWMPNKSIRRLGDMVDQAELMTLQLPPAPKDQEPPKLPASLAFGIVADGVLGVTINGETRWVGPGQVFDVPSGPQGDKPSISLAAATKTVSYWAFSRETVANMGFVRKSGAGAAGDRE